MSTSAGSLSVGLEVFDLTALTVGSTYLAGDSRIKLEIRLTRFGYSDGEDWSNLWYAYLKAGSREHLLVHSGWQMYQLIKITPLCQNN